MSSIPLDEDPRQSDALLRALQQHREQIVTKIHAANGVTEREVLAIGEALRLIVDEARDYVATSRGALEALTAASLADMLERHRTAMTEFATAMHAKVEAQNAAAQAATDQLRRIVELGRAIEQVATESRILALNANIHASRAGSTGESFKVIAQEMKQFSNCIADANTDVQDLAEGLLDILPRFGKLASQMAKTSSAFTEDMAQRVAEAAATNAETKRQVATTMASGEERLQHIVKYSHAALSHLQFQDPIAQSLLACEGEMEDCILLVQSWLIAGSVELDARPSSDASPETSLESGEVTLF